MVAAAGALEMTGGQRAELERLARSHTAPAREVRQAKALLWAAAEGTAAVGRARAANQGSMMRPARASKPDGYLLGSYRIRISQEYRRWGGTPGPAREVRQTKALLWATDGVSIAEIARRYASTPKSVRRWRSRFAAEG